MTEVTAIPTAVGENETVTAARRQSLVVPREHGAWGILLVPLITGAAAGLLAGGSALPLVPLSLAVLSLFWLRTPFESWIGATPLKARSPAELNLVRTACLILGSLSAVSLVWLFHGGRNRDLLWIGLFAALAFAGQAIVRKVWRQGRTAAQIIGAAGLTSVAAAAYYVTAGNWSRTAWSLWILNLLFAADQIEFVQLRIHAARAEKRAEKMSLGRIFLVLQLLLLVLLLAACAQSVLNWYAALAFVPVLWRGFAWFFSPFQPLVVHALGKRELAHAILFGILLITSFAVAI